MTDNPFRQFFDAGYKRLVPIVPPGAPLSPNSSLFKRMEKRPDKDPRGKAPGVRKDNGDWVGFDWMRHDTTAADLDTWASYGAGVGIRTGAGLLAVDIDTLHAHYAALIGNAARTILGAAPARIGRAPKLLLPYRCAEDLPYRRLKFDGGIVELLTEGKQFVAAGTHPVTNKPYEWQPHVYFLETLTPITGQQLDQFFAHLAAILPASTIDTETTAAARADVDQAQLAGEPETVASAVAALPNGDVFATRDSYIRVGAAIRASLPDDPDRGLELFQDWASRWTGGENDPDVVAADWSRIKPPFSVGAQYLYELAQRHGSFTTAEAWFDGSAAQQAASDPWASAPAETQELEPIRWIDFGAWEGKDPPKREWEVEGWIPRRQVTLLYGDGGIGKTLAIHQYAVCAAAGLPWLGQPTRQARVMCVFCEDDEDELQRRHHDILRSLNITGADLGGRLRIVSRTGEDNLFAVVNRSTGALSPTPFYRQIVTDAVDWRADVTVADTIADTFGGSEIDRGHVNAFVKTILGGIARATGGSVVALGHPSVAGKAEGRSGSTAWSNAARSRIYLRYPEGVDRGDVRELEGMKLNYGPKGSLLKLQWKSGVFQVLAQSRPIDLNAFKDSNVPSLEATVEALVLAAWADAGGVELSTSKRSAGIYAPTILRDNGRPDGLRAYSDDEILAALRRLTAAGAVVASSKGRLLRAPSSVFN